MQSDLLFGSVFSVMMSLSMLSSVVRFSFGADFNLALRLLYFKSQGHVMLFQMIALVY